MVIDLGGRVLADKASAHEIGIRIVSEMKRQSTLFGLATASIFDCEMRMETIGIVRGAHAGRKD